MTNRSQRGEIEFGSDAFLDVVANIVGILIILMVITGVRVSRTPVPAGPEDRPGAAADAVVFDPEGAFPPVLSPPEPEITAPNPPEPSPDLIRRQRELQAEIAALEADAAARSDRLQQTIRDEKALASGLGEHTRLVALEEHAAEQGRLEVQQLRGLIDETRSRLVDLEQQKDHQERIPANVVQIRHRLTPVSREVRDEELHFQVIQNHVAYVPVDELVERLRGQIVRQKDWLMKFPRHQGEVGPVRGFSMDYIVQREPMSTLDQLRQGQGVVRISVSEWVLKPGPDVVVETLPQALRPDSEFVRVLRMADAGATLTFWVYPDSFTMFRELQAFAHREGFTVAARPMPFGVPIAGSPEGTRSAGQ